MKRFLLLIIFFSVVLASQLSAQQSFIQSDLPSREQSTKLFFVSGLVTYICVAAQPSPVTSVTISAISNASPGSFTATAHGISLDARPTLTISGGTGAWTAINGTFTATPVDANTFTIAVDTTAFGAVAGTIVVTTTAPRTNKAVWTIQEVTTNGSAVTTSVLWAQGGLAACDNRATLSYQ